MHSIVQDNIEGSSGWTSSAPPPGKTSTEASDRDFLVSFEPMPPVEHADRFFGLLKDLKRLFGRRIDLLEAEPIENPYLRESIVRSRKVLYEAD
jgi:predicted nucleotidyltransferase